MKLIWNFRKVGKYKKKSLSWERYECFLEVHFGHEVQCRFWGLQQKINVNQRTFKLHNIVNIYPDGILFLLFLYIVHIIWRTLQFWFFISLLIVCKQKVSVTVIRRKVLQKSLPYFLFPFVTSKQWLFPLIAVQCKLLKCQLFLRDSF